MADLLRWLSTTVALGCYMYMFIVMSNRIETIHDKVSYCFVESTKEEKK